PSFPTTSYCQTRTFAPEIGWPVSASITVPVPLTSLGFSSSFFPASFSSCCCAALRGLAGLPLPPRPPRAAGAGLAAPRPPLAPAGARGGRGAANPAPAARGGRGGRGNPANPRNAAQQQDENDAGKKEEEKPKEVSGTGTVIDADTGQPISGAKVRVWQYEVVGNDG